MVRSPPAGDEEKLRLRIGPAGRGAGRASLSCAKRGVPRDAGDAKGDWSKKGRRSKRNPSSDWDPRAEATPELVSQDRGAGDLRVTKADEHRQILRSAQMGAGSNAGPHFSLWGSIRRWQPCDRLRQRPCAAHFSLKSARAWTAAGYRRQLHDRQGRLVPGSRSGGLQTMRGASLILANPRLGRRKGLVRFRPIADIS